MKIFTSVSLGINFRTNRCLFLNILISSLVQCKFFTANVKLAWDFFYVKWISDIRSLSFINGDIPQPACDPHQSWEKPLPSLDHNGRLESSDLPRHFPVSRKRQGRGADPLADRYARGRRAASQHRRTGPGAALLPAVRDAQQQRQRRQHVGRPAQKESAPDAPRRFGAGAARLEGLALGQRQRRRKRRRRPLLLTDRSEPQTAQPRHVQRVRRTQRFPRRTVAYFVRVQQPQHHQSAFHGTNL